MAKRAKKENATLTTLGGCYVAEKSIIEWMQEHIRDYYSPREGIEEADLTGLGEDAADHFNTFVDDDEYGIPERIWELAFEVMEALSKNSKDTY